MPAARCRLCWRTMWRSAKVLAALGRGRTRELTVLGVLVYAATIHLVYMTQIAPRFSYLGYSYRTPEILGYLAAIVAACVVALLLPKTLRRASDFVLWMLFVLAVLPSVLVVHFSGFTSPESAFSTSAVLSLVYSAAAVATRRKQPPVRLGLNLSGFTFWAIFAAVSATTYGYLAIKIGLRVNLVSIFEVYELRAGYKEALATAPGLAYLVSIQANVLNPFLFARGIYSRRWALLFGSTLGQVLIYSVAGLKTVLFSIPALIVVALLFRVSRRPAGSIFLWGTVAAALTALVFDGITRSYIATSLFTRRFLVTSGMLMSAYVTFFSDHPHARLGYSVLAGHVDYPYDKSPARVVGEWVTGADTIAMNAHFLADGFANFGWLGVVGVAVVFVIYLRVLDRVTVGIPLAASAVVLVMPAITISNTSILTAMLSHGLVACVVVFALSPRMGWGLTPRRDR